MARVIDFDAAWEALRPSQEAPKIKIMGAEIELPADKPVALVLLEHRLRDPEQRNQVGFDQVLDTLRIVVGDDTVDAWVKKGMGKAQLTTAVMVLGPAWAVLDSGGDDEGEAQPPETGDASSTTSSTDGPSSPPTSTASTASPT